MTDHTHTEFGAIEVQLRNIDKKQDTIVGTVEKIFSRLEGKNGITSEIAVLKEQRKSTPSHKTLVFYSSVGGGLTVVGFVIIKYFLMG